MTRPGPLQAPASPSPFEPGSLTVLVLQPDSSGVVGVFFVTISRSDIETRQAPTGKGGSVLFDKLTPGTWKVTVEAGNMHRVPVGGGPFKPEPARDSAIVAPGPEDSDFTFVMTPPVGFLSVQVKDRTGKPMDKVPVSVDGGPPRQTGGGGMVLFGPQPIGRPLPILAGAAGKPTAKPFFTRLQKTGEPVKFAPADSSVILSVGEVRLVPMQLEELKLQIVKIDDHFAPSVETLDFRFAIKGLARHKVVLTIEAEHYPGKLVVQRDLSDGERADGENNLIGFTGKIEVGTLKDGFINPLMGPFKVTLLHEDADKFDVLKDERSFKVLYHTTDLKFAKSTPDEKEPSEAAEPVKFVQFKLAALNYDAGAVNGTLGAVGASALRRFQRAHYVVGSQTLLAINGTADVNTVAAIKAATPLVVWEAGKDPLTQDARHYVHDNLFNDRGVSIANGTPVEFPNRKPNAEDRMERPFILLEAEIKLKNKAGSAVSAPKAIGPVSVAWEVEDTPEDAGAIPAANVLAKLYVGRARHIGASATVAGAAAIDADGDNAPDTFDGMRRAAPADYIKAWFPTDAESRLEPFSIQRYDTEVRGGKTFHRAVVNAWDDPTLQPLRRGRAGICFRHSKVAGDTARLRLSLTFKGLPNQAKLEADHAAVKTLVKQTGTWTVFRRSRISAYCQMTAPTRASGTPRWADIAGRYAEAFIEFENAGAPLQILSYTSVVNAAGYTAAIMGLPAAQRPPGVTAANLQFRPDALYGGAFPPRPQNPGEPAVTYALTMGSQMSAWAQRVASAILQLIYTEARKTSAEGYVILDFRTHPPITGQDWDPVLSVFKPTANPAARNYIDAYRGFSTVDGAVTMSVDNPFDVNCYLAHENGHARFLQHHKFTDAGAASAVPGDHDDAQDRCVMSYTVPPDKPEDWKYHFCGKCILRLRGWNVPLLPNKYT